MYKNEPIQAEVPGQSSDAEAGQHSHEFRTMDRETRDRILIEQLPQVRYIARRIHDRLPQQVSIEDLVHAGVLGLIDALAKYNEARQVQFKTYAKFRIRGAILDSLRELDWSPRELRRKARQVETASAEISHALGRSATGAEIAGRMGLTLESFQRLLGELEGLELERARQEAGAEEHGHDLCEELPGDPRENPLLVTMQSELYQLLGGAISELSEKEQQVLSLYYFEELTMKEAGAVLGVGESRVSQIHSLALLRLRNRMRVLLAGWKFPPQSAARPRRSAAERSADGG